MSRDNRRNGRSYYAPPSRGNSSSHSVLGYWVPLVVTGTIAIGGLAAWIWSERTENDEDDYPGPKPQRPPPGQGKPYPTQGSQSYPGPPPPQQTPSGAGSAPPVYPGGPTPGGEAAAYYQQDSQSRDVYASGQEQYEQSGWYGRAQGLMRRTPSPQQFFDSASKQVSAGFAAAGAALGSIVEEEKDDDGYADRQRTARSEERRADRRTSGKEEREKEGFSDHERWSEEADERQRTSNVEAESSKRVSAARDQGKDKSRSKRSVAIVVSAETSADASADEDAGYRTEHASILSHLPTTHTATDSTTDLYVLIHAPNLTSLPPLDYQPRGHGIPSSVGSTYSNISTPAATPGSELQSISPRIDAQDKPTKTFDLLYQQALTLVPSPTHILPFTTASGFVPILRHLAPNLVYVSDTLAGEEGANLAGLRGWVGNAVLVAGDQGTGGLADTTETETEDERDGGRRKERRESKWYERSEMVGLGKGVEVVDAARVGDDFERRVAGRE